jgi:hypothetical protein
MRKEPFDELDALRNGTTSPAHAEKVAKRAADRIKHVRAEIARRSKTPKSG